MEGRVEVKRVIRRGIELAARFEPLRRILFEFYDRRLAHVHSIHPIDSQYAIRTSGALPGSVLRVGYSAKKNAGYFGSQPSIIRRALNIIPNHNDAVFIDVGCGKGRALVVASEFPFRSIIGVELSPELAELAEENSQVVARNFPKRTPITVVNTDALNYGLPEGHLVIYLYNPFGKDLIRRLLTNIETALLEGDRQIRIIYYNPVCGDIFDRSSMLRRIYAESIPYDSAEMGFGPDSSDVVIIWQDAKSAPANTPSGADRGIVVSSQGLRAELAD
jgi:SAM-dependent methyltransferase